MAPTIPLIARVVCRSEGSGEQRPTAVELAGDRVEVAEILSDGIAGPGLAGGKTERRVVVKLMNGEVLDLHRILPNGEWRVCRKS